MDETSQASFETVIAFITAKGDRLHAMSPLIANDGIWHDEGGSTLPWILGRS